MVPWRSRHRMQDGGSDVAEVLLFHHAQGQTMGFHAFADDLRRSGHTVHTPDLFDGRTFDSILFYSCVAVSEFGSSWPAGVPVQIHGMDADPIFAGEGDVDAARALVESAPNHAELFLYPGDQHYFADSSLPSFRPEAAALLLERVLASLKDR
jgi:dienelactone hydrolase